MNNISAMFSIACAASVPGPTGANLRSSRESQPHRYRQMIADAALRQRYFFLLGAERQGVSLITAAQHDKPMLDDLGCLHQPLPSAPSIDHARRDHEMIEKECFAAVEVRTETRAFFLGPLLGEQIV